MMSWTCCPFPRARAIRTPLNAPGIEPRQSHLTSPRCTVPRRRCTNEPTGFITALATRSDETAASGGTPKKSTSTGVISAPPPMPVRPTTMPIPNAASESNGSRWMRPPAHRNLRIGRDATPRLDGPVRNHHGWTESNRPCFLRVRMLRENCEGSRENCEPAEKLGRPDGETVTPARKLGRLHKNSGPCADNLAAAQKFPRVHRDFGRLRVGNNGSGTQ